MKKEKDRKVDPRKSSGETGLVVFLVVLIIVLICAIGYVLVSRNGSAPGLREDTANPTEEAVAPNTAATSPEADHPSASAEATRPDDRLPYSLEDGKLEIESLFQYTGLNPDCYWEEGSNVGTITLVNKSDEYLESLELTITMTDGTKLQFIASDIPAGKSVWAYEKENTACDASAVLSDVRCTAVFRQDNGLATDQVSVSVSGVDVTLKNVSGSDLSGLEIRCHNVLDDVYFGGTAYIYPVESLPAGNSVTISALDCFLGEPGVAIVDYKR